MSQQNGAPRLLFNTMLALAIRAGQAVGVSERRFRVGGLTLACRFASRELEPLLTRALAHNAVEAGPSAPDGTLHIWDTASSGVAMVDAPWQPDDYNVRGEIRGWTSDGILVALNPDGVLVSIFDTRRSTGVLWVRDWRTVPSYEKASPLRLLLHWWLREQGRQYVHAGAVGSPDGAVLLAGRSGSGKSNTSLGALGAGLGYLSDDYCAVGLEPEPRVYSLYSTGKTGEADLERLPFLRPHVSNPIRPDHDKALYFLNEVLPERMVREAPLKAIVLPHITGSGPTRLRQASAAEAVMALAPSTIGQLAYAGPEVTVSLGRLARALPCLHLDIAAGSTDAPTAIAAWLHQQGHPA